MIAVVQHPLVVSSSARREIWHHTACTPAAAPPAQQPHAPPSVAGPAPAAPRTGGRRQDFPGPRPAFATHPCRAAAAPCQRLSPSACLPRSATLPNPGCRLTRGPILPTPDVVGSQTTCDPLQRSPEHTPASPHTLTYGFNTPRNGPVAARRHSAYGRTGNRFGAIRRAKEETAITGPAVSRNTDRVMTVALCLLLPTWYQPLRPGEDDGPTLRAGE